MKTVLVLGARGGVGNAVAQAFVAAGWRVLGLVRKDATVADGVIPITADLYDTKAVIAASGPVDVVFNGLNLPYPQWATHALPMFEAAADLAEALGARHIYPGNVYNFGAGMPAELTPDTSFAPTTRKGRIRVAIEAMLRSRAEAGRLRTTIIRAGDFIGPTALRGWMGQLIIKDLHKGAMVSPGRYDTVHAWAYLPDLAQAIVRLADAEDRLSAYDVFHFDSHNVTMRDLAQAAQVAMGRKVRLSRMPRFVFSLMGMFDPFMREAMEMMYLWDVPHALKDDRLARLIGPVPRTALADVLRAMLTAMQTQKTG